MSKAYRTKVELVVYSDEPLTEHWPEGDLWEPVNGLIWDMTEGDKIGDWSVTEQSTLVEGNQLVEELVAIGNDGAFFDHEDEEDEQS